MVDAMATKKVQRNKVWTWLFFSIPIPHCTELCSYSTIYHRISFPQRIWNKENTTHTLH